MQITKRHLDFLEEAKTAFETTVRQETYRNKDADLIALRYGADRDCIMIYELGEEVGFFAQMMGRAPELTVPAEREEVQWFSKLMELQLKFNEDKGGWSNCTDQFLAQQIDKQHSRLDRCENPEEFRRRCVNIANFAMMLADNAKRKL